MEKQGFDRDWAAKYWVAHWKLPSIQMGFEMLHRGLVSMDNIRDLLRTADIAPVWHEPLIGISYAPYTRVDVRRMHALGILSDAQLVKAYKDLGYDDEHAANMSQFTIMYNLDEERTASKAEILRGYSMGILTRQEALDDLMGLAYSQSLAEYYLSMEDYKITESETEEELDVIGALYANNEIDETTARASMGKLGLNSGRIERLLKVWGIRRKAKPLYPTKAELESFFKRGIVSEATFRQELTKRGYVDTYVQYYWANLVAEIHEDAVKEEERAAKEAERIRKAEIKTAYEQDRADLNYKIAQARTLSIEIQVQLAARLAAPERRAKMDIIETSTLTIARIQSEIADKRVTLTDAKSVLRQLAIVPELEDMYDIVDSIDLQIAELNATIADLQASRVETKAAIRRATPGAEIEEGRKVVDSILTDIAYENAEIARLKLIIAGAKSELALEWTSEDIAAMQEELRQIRLHIAELEEMRARLKLTV